MQSSVLSAPPARVAAPIYSSETSSARLETMKPQPRVPLQQVTSECMNIASPVNLAPIKGAQAHAQDQDEPSFESLGLTHKQALELQAGIDMLNVEENRAFSRLQAAYDRTNAASKGQAKVAAPAKPTTNPSKKRKAGPETSLAEDIAAYTQDLSHIEVDDMFVDKSCTVVRTCINQVLDGGIMKKGEFCDAIGSSNRSLNTFLQKMGNDGASTGSYINAWAWFKQRELAGLKMPDVKKRQKTEAAAAASGSSASGAGPAAKKSKTAVASGTLPDISQVHLDGEETDSVPVFDTADELRKKISAHLKTPGLTQAQFGRDLYAQLQEPTCKGIGSKQLSDFRGKKGPTAGCTSAVFYAAYVYFEKIRIAKGKPKSKHRMEMELVHGSDGMRRDRDGRSR